jgi:hypothetical protein
VKRVLAHDPLTGITTHFHPELGGGFRLETTQDVQSIVDLNKALQNAEISKGEHNEMWHAATVPMVILQQWANEAGLNMKTRRSAKWSSASSTTPITDSCGRGFSRYEPDPRRND